MHLLYITFGPNLKNHSQAWFSIYSFLAARAESGVTAIHIVTDMPAFYKGLGNAVNVIAVNEQQLEEWKGPHHFFWRIKIKAIEMLCARFPGEAVMYLDSDTFLYTAATPVLQAIRAGKACMHEQENLLSQAGSKTEKRMWAQVSGKLYAGVAIQPAHAMWNAGVVATPNTNKGRECALALAICDGMSEQQVTPRLIEQFALSVALQEVYGLVAADSCIAHYWSNKDEWDALIEQFFLSAHFQNTTPEQTFDLFRQLDTGNIPVRKRTRSTNLRLQKLVNRWFPSIPIRFVTK